MAHIPYGYVIEDGKVKIDEKESEQVRVFFNAYTGGLSIKRSAEKAGIRKTHCAAGFMLGNKRYLGDEFYPAIIAKETFERAAEMRKQKLTALGRDKPRKSDGIRKRYDYIMKDAKRADRINDKISETTDIAKIQNLLFQRAEAVYKSIKSKSQKQRKGDKLQ